MTDTNKNRKHDLEAIASAFGTAASGVMRQASGLHATPTRGQNNDQTRRDILS
jgi:hypothetical protein